MRIINNRIYIVRGETPTYDATIINEKNGSPYIITEKVINPTIEFVVRPSVYSRDDDFVFRAFIKLTNVHKFSSDEIVEYHGDGVWDNDITPLGGNENKLHRRAIQTNKGTKYEYAYYDGGLWRGYELRLTFMFPYYITSVMEPKTYQYEITLHGGNLKQDVQPEDISLALERDPGTAYKDCPIDITYKKPLLESTDFTVGGSSSE